MKKLSLTAEKRNIFGRKLKKLRQEGILPANVFGKDIKSLAIKIDLKNFLGIYKQAGETGIVDLAVQGIKTSYPVLIHKLQYHPVTDSPLHADFRKIDLKQKVQVAIPVEIVGEAPGVTKGGVLVKVMDAVQVEALPGDLPEKIEADISQLEEIGQFIAIKDLKIDKEKVKLLVADENQIVVKVEEPAKEEVEEKPAVEATAEVAGEEVKPEEGKSSKEEKESPKTAKTAKPEEKPQEKK